MWLQPWQGAELILIVIAVEVWRKLRSEIDIDWRLLPVVTAIGLPALYYAALGAFDPSWKLASDANQAGAQPLWSWPLWMVGLTIGPLVAAGLLAFRARADNWQEVAVRAWPLAVLVVYFLPVGTFPYHSVQGLTLPLSILAVQGLTVSRPRWVPRPQWLWVVPLMLVFTVPGTAHKIRLVRNNIHNVAYPYYIFPGEQGALRWLEQDRRAGGVLASSYGGLLVPAYSGRETYIGPFSWTPQWDLRAKVTGSFFDGKLKPSAARRFVKSTGARFVFQECKGRVQAPPSLTAELGPLVQAVKEFGCARVYILKPTARSDQVSKRVGAPAGG